jgi:hypothetical protein
MREKIEKFTVRINVEVVDEIAAPFLDFSIIEVHKTIDDDLDQHFGNFLTRFIVQ